jgi:biotin carboxyl carrier protein
VSPANAKLVKLLVAVGDTVTEGQAVAIIETA